MNIPKILETTTQLDSKNASKMVQLRIFFTQVLFLPPLPLRQLRLKQSLEPVFCENDGLPSGCLKKHCF